MKRIIIPVLLLIVMLLSGCGSQQKEIMCQEDMKDMKLTIAVPDDIDANDKVLEVCPNAKIVPLLDTVLGVRSVAEGKYDAYVAGKYYIDDAINEGKIDGVKILDEPLITYECALGLSALCKVPDYENLVNETMEELISEGVIDEMTKRWFIDENEQMPEIKLDDNPEYTLNAVTFGQCKPYSFIKDGALTGFDVELLYRVCERNHWGVKLSNAEYVSMLMGLATGKYDIISANLYITSDKEENIIFSIPYTTEEISIAVRSNSKSSSDKKDTQKLEYNTLLELENAKTFAVLTGTVFDEMIKEKYPNAEVKYYQSAVDGALAVSNHKADVTVFDEPVLKYIAACTDGVELMPELLTKDDYHFILTKSERGERLQKEFNEWLGIQRQNGELDKLYDFWCSNEESDKIFDFEALPETKGKIKIATDPSGRPDAYYYNNSLTGYPIELIYNFCRDMGYGAEVSVVGFDSMIPSLVSGKTDIATTFISYTEERAQSVLFTDCVREGGVGLLVRSENSKKSRFLPEIIKSGFEKNFVAEDRWKLVLSGLYLTALITLGGFLLANILGAIFCAFAMSKRRFLKVLANVYDQIMQGTPIVVILMILYYVIFGKSNISGVLVAIFAFGMTSGASLAQQFRGAIESVDIGQSEAALAIGFTKFKTFIGIVLPQACRIILPGYFSEIISLMKGTAIVGYISVIDLTKASDLIRSSTYDAFFPLLSVALIYFLITFGILSLLKYIQKKLAPKRLSAQEEEK